MKKTMPRLAWILLTVLLLLAVVQPAKAAESTQESYDGMPLFLLAVSDEDNELVAIMNAFLAWDAETEGSYLLTSFMAYDFAQNDYNLTLFGDEGYVSPAAALKKDGGICYLYALQLENAPGLERGDESSQDMVILYRTEEQNGLSDPVGMSITLDSGWENTGDGMWTHTGYPVESTFLLGAPAVHPETGAVLGCISMDGDTNMVLGLLDLAFTPNCSIASVSSALAQQSQSDQDQPETEIQTEPDTAVQTQQKEDNLPIGWIIAALAAAGAGYLIYRANARKSSPASEEGTVSLDEPPLPPEPSGQNQEGLEQTRPMALWRLNCIAGTFRGKTFPIYEQLRIGRSSRCTLIFPENTPAVSGEHCQVSVKGEGVVVQDLGSTYGTLLGEKRLEAYREYPMYPGDVLSLAQGSQVFRLEGLAEETGPAVRSAEGKSYRADASGRLTFGRRPENQVRMSSQDGSISGSHCVLYREGGKLYLMDLGSTNGTFFSETERLKPNTPYRIQRGRAFFLTSPKYTFVVTEE